MASLISIRFQGTKVWNSFNKNILTASLNGFEENINIELLRDY